MDGRWAFLRAQLAAVRGLLRLQVATIERHDRLCMLVNAVEDASSSQLRAILDAVRLLSLLGQLDTAALELVLKDAFDLDTTPFKLASKDVGQDYLLLHRVVFKISDDEWDSARLVKLFDEVNKEPLAGFYSTACQIQKTVRRRVDKLHIPVALLITVCPVVSAGVLNTLLELRRKNQSWDFTSDSIVGISSTLGIDVISLEVKGDEFPEFMAHAIEKLLAEGGGVTFSKIEVSLSIHPESEHCIGLFRSGQFYERIICRSTSPTEHVTKIDSLVINTKNEHYPEYNFLQLFSALAAARTVSSVDINLNDMELGASTRSHFPWSRWYYQNLAFAFFSKFARPQSSVKHVRLRNVNLDEWNQVVMSDILEENDEIRVIFECASTIRTRTKNPIYTKALVKKKAEIEILSSVEGLEKRGGKLANAVDNALVLSHCDLASGLPPVTALIPGFGECRVDRADLIPTGVFNPSSPVDSSLGIESLDIEFALGGSGPDVFTGGLPYLLCQVGASLTTLRLSKMDASEFDVTTVLRSCPRLQYLALSGSTVCAIDLINGIKDLGLTLKDISCEFDLVNTLFQELADETSNITKNLTSLECLGTSSGYVLQTEGDVRAVSTMLRSNQTIAYVKFAVRESIYAYMITMVEPYQNQSLSLMRSRLPQLCRLAFLSIFGCYGHSDRKRAKAESPIPTKKLMIRPDDNVVALIFSLAADHARRRIDFVPVK